MKLKERLEKRKFTVTCQVHLPRGKTPDDYLKEISGLWGRVDGVRFKSLSADAPISDSLELCRLLGNKDFDPVFQVGTREQNRLEIQEALVHASSVGVENVLVFAEDYRITGDSLDEMMYFHVDSGKFFSVLDSLGQGRDVHGKDLDGSKRFFVGSGVGASLAKSAPDQEIREMEQLADLGTKYFITTPVFDIDEFAKFMKRVGPLGIPVIAEVAMLHTAMQARQLIKLSGMHIPEHVIQRIEKAPVKFDESVKMLLEIVEQLRHLCAGVHVLPFGWESKVGSVLQNIKRHRPG